VSEGHIHAPREDDHGRIRPDRAHRLNDPRRLESQVSEQDLARLLALRGDEDLLDLGSGTGFYTDRVAALTTGTVYAVELQPEMNNHYRERGLPANVRLILGDMSALPMEPASAGPQAAAPADAVLADAALRPASVDVACTIATWHEVEGKVDVPGLAKILRPSGRLVVIDWRKDAESWESGPPRDIRFTKEEVAEALAPYFAVASAENLGRFMFAVVARREDPPKH
jgi:SAM-dependent methyltransferase